MRNFEIDEKLAKVLSKLMKKDKTRYEIIQNKMDEIRACEDVEHYKNLRTPLQNFKRVHIDKSSILLFKYDKERDFVLFYSLEHHDEAYVT